ncbi:MAG TPA: protoporphyrinogen oxidase, partial [Cytophagaceae bacterium]
MIGIIGAGISGLSTGYHLQKAGVDYILLEASDVPGGYIKTYREKNYVLEIGPNSLMADSELLTLIKELGIENELVASNPVSKNRYIYKGRRYRKLPSGPLSLLFSNYFSISTRYLILKELFLKPGSINSSEDDSLETFFLRHFGREVVNYALDPFISGIYAGNPKELLVSETFPSLLEIEKKYGSVLKGLAKAAGERKASYNFKKGMQTLTDALAAKLKYINLGTRVEKIENKDNQYLVTARKNGELKSYTCQELVFASDTASAASLLEPLAPSVAQKLAAVEYAPMVAVHSIYKKHHIGKVLDGFGALNPRSEDLFISGTIWTSSVFPGRCADDEVVFTSFV